ncbi:MAG TPA: response regulator [Verrucomicrobiae bacterium]|nr:response regulator [Verrucomicrobiae bacterium]
MKNILIIDDDPNIRRVYSDLLVSEGFGVSAAKSAEEATELLLREEADLVLLDINMPDINGIIMRDVLHVYNDKLKVIIASVYPVNQQQRWIARADDYFDKSQGAEVLLDKVRKVLEAA